MQNLLNNFLEATNTFDFGIALFVFIAYIIVDALYAKYTLDVANYNEYKAATTGSLIHLFLAFGVISYTQNWLYIIPLAMGSWIGTYIAVKKAKKVAKKQK